LPGLAIPNMLLTLRGLTARWTSDNDVEDQHSVICLFAYGLGRNKRLNLAKDWTDSLTGHQLLLLKYEPGRSFNDPPMYAKC